MPPKQANKSEERGTNSQKQAPSVKILRSNSYLHSVNREIPERTVYESGIIESKTYDEISVGDTARTEHVLTTDDAMAFASISGFNSVLKSEELIERAGGIPPTGPNMWCASLVSGLFSMQIPGPGCTLVQISLSFHNRLHVGDRILVNVEVTAKEDATKLITFACEAINHKGTSIFTGTAQLTAPPQKLRWSTLPVPQVIVHDPYRRYHGLIARATSKPPVKTAVVLAVR